MGRNATEEEIITEIEAHIHTWKEAQWKRAGDEKFFHYSQSIIDRLESRLDVLTRSEN